MSIFTLCFLLLVPWAPAATQPALEDVYEEDISFALTQLKQHCGGFFRLKDVDWKKVSREFSKQSKKTANDEEHFVQLVRLLARIKDGHCYVDPAMPPAEWQVEQKSPGFFLCQVDKKFYVKTAWSGAQEVGLAPGMEVLTIDGEPMKKWLPARIARARDRRSFSTDQQALFWTLNRGFSKPSGDRLKIEFKDLKGKKRKRTITINRASSTPNGPAFVPEGYKSLGDSVRFARTERGYGYIHFRRIKGELLSELDSALKQLGNVPGMILDFRGNSGGGCDHDAFEARFVPEGKKMPRMARAALSGAGPTTYGGPMIVIVDATTLSAGETTSGMFKEDGRAYMIGESPTAGMSSQKEWIELPSGKFKLYVSVRSNRSSFNGGRGIEGIGIAPQEVVQFDPEELAAGVDTLLRRAQDLLDEYPQKEVRYDPKKYGWQP